VARALEISEQTYNRWRNQYGGMKPNDAKELRRLKDQKERLKGWLPISPWTASCRWTIRRLVNPFTLRDERTSRPSSGRTFVALQAREENVPAGQERASAAIAAAPGGTGTLDQRGWLWGFGTASV